MYDLVIFDYAYNELNKSMEVDCYIFLHVEFLNMNILRLFLHWIYFNIEKKSDAKKSVLEIDGF